MLLTKQLLRVLGRLGICWVVDGMLLLVSKGDDMNLTVLGGYLGVLRGC